ncbi:MAG: bacteriohemerythrin [Chlorobium sp.]
MEKYSDALWAQILGSFSAKQIAEFRKQFNVFDEDKDGHIEHAELKKLVSSLKMNVSDAEISEMTSQCDFDNSGTIEFDEFLQMVFALHFGEGSKSFAQIYAKTTGSEVEAWKKPELTYSETEVNDILAQFAWFKESEENAKKTNPEDGEYPKFVWSDELYGVKFPLIDEEHKRLFGILERLENILREKGSNEELAHELDELLAYTDYHFKSEEEVMTKYKFPQQAEHMKIHQAFTEKMMGLVFDFKKTVLYDVDDIYEDKKFTWETIFFIRTWLVEHIQKQDTEFGKHYLRVKDAN